MSTLAVKVVLDTRRALLKNAGSKDPIYPFKLRVTFARKQRPPVQERICSSVFCVCRDGGDRKMYCDHVRNVGCGCRGQKGRV